MMISVVIATFKRPDSLRQTLKSLLICKVSGDFEYEIVVVDNNSKDQTEHTVKELMPSFDGRLKYIFEPKQGKNSALNTGIKKSSGEIIAITDDDCLVDQSWLIQVYEATNKYQVDILGGKVFPVFSAEIPDWIDMNNKIFYGPLVHFNLGDNYIDSRTKLILPPGANMIIRRSSYDKFNGFEQGTRAQDTEICYSWYKRGAQIGYAPGIIVHHITPDSRLNKDYFRRWQFLSGKNSAHIFKDEYEHSKRNVGGVPLWVYKRLLKSCWRYIKEFFSNKRFVNELWIRFHLGEIEGIKGQKISFEDDLRS